MTILGCSELLKSISAFFTIEFSLRDNFWTAHELRGTVQSIEFLNTTSEKLYGTEIALRTDSANRDTRSNFDCFKRLFGVKKMGLGKVVIGKLSVN